MKPDVRSVCLEVMKRVNMLRPSKDVKYLFYKENPEISEYKKFSREFDKNIKNITRVLFNYGSAFGSVSNEYEITIMDGKANLNYGVGMKGNRYTGKVEVDKDGFLSALSELELGAWKENCSCYGVAEKEKWIDLDRKNGFFIFDGEHWSLYFWYLDGQRITFTASNFWPVNYGRLDRLFRSLTGDPCLQDG